MIWIFGAEVLLTYRRWHTSLAHCITHGFTPSLVPPVPPLDSWMAGNTLLRLISLVSNCIWGMYTYRYEEILMNPWTQYANRELWSFCDGMRCMQLTWYGTLNMFRDDCNRCQVRKHPVRSLTPIHVYLLCKLKNLDSTSREIWHPPHRELLQTGSRNTLWTLNNSVGYLNSQIWTLLKISEYTLQSPFQKRSSLPCTLMNLWTTQ